MVGNCLLFLAMGHWGQVTSRAGRKKNIQVSAKTESGKRRFQTSHLQLLKKTTQRKNSLCIGIIKRILRRKPHSVMAPARKNKSSFEQGTTLRLSLQEFPALIQLYGIFFSPEFRDQKLRSPHRYYRRGIRLHYELAALTLEPPFPSAQFVMQITNWW